MGAFAPDLLSPPAGAYTLFVVRVPVGLGPVS